MTLGLDVRLDDTKSIDHQNCLVAISFTMNISIKWNCIFGSNVLPVLHYEHTNYHPIPSLLLRCSRSRSWLVKLLASFSSINTRSPLLQFYSKYLCLKRFLKGPSRYYRAAWNSIHIKNEARKGYSVIRKRYVEHSAFSLLMRLFWCG